MCGSDNKSSTCSTEISSRRRRTKWADGHYNEACTGFWGALFLGCGFSFYSFLGIREHLQNRIFSDKAWRVRNHRQIVEELTRRTAPAALNYSMPNGLGNSEKSEILTRDATIPTP